MADLIGSTRRQTVTDALDRYLPVLLALTPTPLLLFISTSSDIYLRNQSLLGYRYQVLAPFLGLFLATVMVGIVLAILSKRSPAVRFARFAMTAYFLVGPVFLIFVFCRGLQGVLPGARALHETIFGLALWPLLLLAATVVLNRRLNSASVVRAFAALGIVLLAYEGGVLLYHIWFTGRPTSSVRYSSSGRGASNLPNIYHLIFDAYQTDLLEHTLTESAKKSLGGFTFFPNNKAEWGWTPMSLGTVFSGRDYFYEEPSAAFVSDAFSSKASVLYWLKSIGYETVAFVPVGWSGQGTYFDSVAYHDDAALDDLLPLNEEALWNLWLYANTPVPLRGMAMRRKLAGLNEEDMDLLENGRLLPSSQPVISYLGFQKMMEAEKGLSPTGRYTLVHVIIPHHPMKLSADCTYSMGSSTTNVIEQSQCALGLIGDYIELLKDLGRFDDSLILIHGDHGGPYRTQDRQLVTMNRPRSLDAVLLVKPVGTPNRGDLELVDARTSLLQIPSILMASVTDARDSHPNPAPWSRPRAVVPWVEGEPLESAVRILRRNGFSLGSVTEVETSRYAAGTVISQDPTPYAAGEETTAVTVVVSSGPPKGPDVMPDFVGRDVAELSEWLTQKSLPASLIEDANNPIAPKGMVVGQTPRAGTRTDDDTDFVFYVNRAN